MDLTYSVPLKAKLKLYCTDPEHEDFETVVQDVYLGTVPYMTPQGTFVINGAERVVVSQLTPISWCVLRTKPPCKWYKTYILHELFLSKDHGLNLRQILTMLCMLTSIEKRNYPLQLLLRAIGYESDKDILEIFNLADEIKVSKTALKKVVGRKLAARVLKSWVEDFVDEDTGEVVSIERNEVIIDRETDH